MRSKAIISLGVFLLVGFIIWHFAIKDYNYRVAYTSSQPPGVVYDHIINWTPRNVADSLIIATWDQVPFSEIRQTWTVRDSVFDVRWSIEQTDHSYSKVRAFITDEANSFSQNLSAPFAENDFVKRSINTVRQVGEDLVRNSENYKVSVVSKGEISGTHCAYISLESKISDKASTMVRNIGIVMNYLGTHEIPLAGHPFIEVTDWDLETGHIAYDFCFPIEKRESFPDPGQVKFKTTQNREALKAIFNGNYKISDKAWYTLLAEAESQNMPVEHRPVEIFLNDPHGGGNDLEWEAEVYLPLK